MKQNVAGQTVGAQMVSASDGSAFTGTVNVFVTGDAGTQTAGSVGSGVCTHEGNGYHSYAPAQAETNFTHIAWTFTGTGAIPATVQVYTSFPQTGDNFARLGAPVGASISADIAGVQSDTNDIQSRLPAALVSGRMDSNMQAAANDVITAAVIATGAIDADALAADAGTELGTAVWASAARTLTAIDEDNTTLDLDATIRAAVGLASANLDTQLDALPTAAENTTAVWAAGTRTLTALDEDDTIIDIDSTVRSALGVSIALDTQFDNLPTAAENATAVWAAGTRTLTAIDEDNTTLDLDATIRAAVGLAAADLDTQLGALPTAGENADAVWDEALAGHGTAGSAGAALSAAGAAGDPWSTLLPGSYGAGTAGKIIGDNINATISSRASQTSVDDLPTNAELATALDPLPTAAENATAVWASAARTLTAIDEDNTTLDLDATIRAAVGLASANLDTQLDALPTAAENTTAVWAAGTRSLTVIDEDSTTLDLDGTIRAAVGLASANLDTQFGAVPTDAEIADKILGRNLAGGSDTGRVVRDALRALRNRQEIVAGNYNVYLEDDSTLAWTGVATTTPGDPLSSIDPA